MAESYFIRQPILSKEFDMHYLVVAGGGGATSFSSGFGGGGAGGYLENTLFTVEKGKSYKVTVGAGGASNTGYPNPEPTSGNNSVFSNIISFGGGWASQFQGLAGGSGGGAGMGTNDAGNGISGQGNRGGDSTISFDEEWDSCGAGGGGGAGAVGGKGDYTGCYGGNGGTGKASSITGVSTYYAGGGGGSAYGWGEFVSSVIQGSGGIGGGGSAQSSTAGSGQINTGGGAGSGAVGGGGSGIVILKIPDKYTASFSAGVTHTLITSVPGYKVYKITATSTTSETVTFS